MKATQKILLSAVSLLVFSCVGLLAEESIPVQEVTIGKGQLLVVFRDNTKSPGVLSGIDSLRNMQLAPDYDAYPGDSAGLNFEHVISGHRNSNNKFTPRYGDYRLYQLPDGKSVCLVRKAQDSPWKIASTLTYTVNEPYYIDFEFRCSPSDASLFGEHGFAVFLFANYMNDVEEIPLHFLGLEKSEATERWISADAPKTHPHWHGGGNYRSLPAKDLTYDEDVEFRLNTWSYEWPRFTRPFYYGRAGRGMTLILMFDRMHTERDQVRFSLYKFKLPRYPRPAWDFQYVINRVESNQNYGFRGRLVFKKFVSPEDCLNEYEEWRAHLSDETIWRKSKSGNPR